MHDTGSPCRVELGLRLACISVDVLLFSPFAERCCNAQVTGISTEVQQQVGSAVQAALSQSLPQQLAGPHLKAALEASLGNQLQQALARPLQDSFTAAFQHQLMPAFEGACRDMFAQVSFLLHTAALCGPSVETRRQVQL